MKSLLFTLSFMAIATSPTRDKFPLSPKKVTKKTITSIIAWVVLILIFGGFLIPVIVAMGKQVGYLLVPLILIDIALLAIVIVPTYLYQKWYFNTYFYDLTSDYIIIRKDPITPKEITIPYERVQDVYVDQDLFDRFFGLYDVHVSSATVSSGMEAHIDGVEKPAADGLRAVLLETVKSRISRKV